MVGWQKVQSRKKSFEALVQWLGPFMADVVKRLAQEKESSTATVKDNIESEEKPVPVDT